MKYVPLAEDVLAVMNELAGTSGYNKVNIEKDDSVCRGWQCVRIYCNTSHMALFLRQTLDERARGTATRLHTGRNGRLSSEPVRIPRASFRGELVYYLRDPKVKDIRVELAA